MRWVCFLFLAAVLFPAVSSRAAEAPLSEASQACLDCHAAATPGIVADWRLSAHARTTPAQASQKPELERRVSAAAITPALAGAAVGCAECHVRTQGGGPDDFDHEGRRVHAVVSPRDCAACHPDEAGQFQKNIMSQARGNLARNPLFSDLAAQINGGLVFEGGGLAAQAPEPLTEAESCFYCHGTEVKVIGRRTQHTDYGDFEFPVLAGWPNHGVGRLNPDGSLGSCGACHSRHQFSIEMARQPYTCSECHKGPDVPAYPVYQVSKHGNIQAALGKSWDFRPVPWTVGRDFTAPTCAVCHVSLLVDGQGEVVAQRTHQMNDRLHVRLMGLVYAHPHPLKPDTSRLHSPDGLPLPVSLDGRPAGPQLIGPEEQAERRARLEKVCLACHSTSWVKGHWARLDESVETSNTLTLTATRLLAEAWQKGLARGPAQGGSPFDEAIERQWVEQWLFYANSIRFASAMAGADYGVFAQGRWQATRNLRQMHDWLRLRSPAGKE